MEERILPGEVAWYVTGRFYADERGLLRDAGYFLYVAGIPAEDLFRATRGEGTAYLTFLADPFQATPVDNGGLSIGIDPVGEFAVYFNPEPSGDFSDPRSFGRGTEVARFRRASIAVGTTIATLKESKPLVSLNVFSARLISSTPFRLGTRTYDFARLMPNGVTQWGTAAAGIDVATPGFTDVLPFVGSAVAIGGAAGQR